MRARVLSRLTACNAPWRIQRGVSTHWLTFAPRPTSPCTLHCRCVIVRPFTSSESSEQSTTETTTETTPQEEAAPEPVVLFKAPPLTEHYSAALRTVNLSALGSSLGLGVALLGVAPFTAPTPFMVALLLATFQVRLAHTMATRVIRAQMRRHVEEIVQLDAGRFSIRSGHGTHRTLCLSAATAVGERPPLREVLEHGKPFVFMDQELGKIEDPEAFEAMLQCDLAIRNEDLDLKTFEDESSNEARNNVQSLAKISKMELDTIAKKQGTTGTTSPKIALEQAAVQAQVVAAVVFVGGSVIGIALQMQDSPPPGSVTLGPAPAE